MDTIELSIWAFFLAFLVYKFLTRPDPYEQLVYRQLSTILNDPQYRVKGKYED